MEWGSNMRTIAVALELSSEQLQRIQSVAPDWRIIGGKEVSAWVHEVSNAEIIVGWHPSVEEAFLADPDFSVRWVHNWGAGIDQLPLSELRRRGIAVTNASGVHAYPISETILGLMLSLTRKLHTYVRNQVSQTWHHASLSEEMHGKTAGILGVGAIGLETARLCQAFGMRVLGLRRSGTASPYVDEMYDTGDLATLMAKSDYVVNILPYTDDTRHIVDARQFAQMKSTAFYINVGRGQTTDEAALIEALQTGRIAGAGLDVFAQEPLPTDSPLWRLDNVILTPHSSGSTMHYNDRALDIFTENLANYVQGHALSRNVVDLERQY